MRKSERDGQERHHRWKALGVADCRQGQQEGGRRTWGNRKRELDGDDMEAGRAGYFK